MTIRTVGRRLINHWARRRRRHFLLSTSAERRLLFPFLSIIIFFSCILNRDFPTVEKVSAIDHAPTAVRPIVFFFYLFIYLFPFRFLLWLNSKPRRRCDRSSSRTRLSHTGRYRHNKKNRSNKKEPTSWLVAFVIFSCLSLYSVRQVGSGQSSVGYHPP